MLRASVGEVALTVNVVDVNDERPRFELPVYIFDVEENQSPGVEVGVVSAADRELSPFNQFGLSWLTPVDVFTIDSQTGAITTTQALDHEHQVYTVSMRALLGSACFVRLTFQPRLCHYINVKIKMGNGTDVSLMTS